MMKLVTVTTENQEAYLGQILEIENLSFPTPWSPHAFLEELRNPLSYLWALVNETVLLGYICFWMFDSEIQVINIAVHPDARGKGLGKELLIRMIETGVSFGLHHVWLEVRLSNLTARGLYKKLRFEEVGRRRGYYRDTKEDAILMSLTLSFYQPFFTINEGVNT